VILLVSFGLGVCRTRFELSTGCDTVALMEAFLDHLSETTVIAGRVKVLRKQARLSGPALASAMKERGFAWNRTTVAKLETGHRESISVQEWLALALVLDVPPVWLLIDPSGRTPTPVAEGVELDPWSALMWMIGRQVIGQPAGTNWKSEEFDLLSQVQRLWERLADLGGNLHRLKTGKLDERLREMIEKLIREDLDQARECLQRIADAKAAVPQLPAEVVKCAVEQGIDLPGQEGFAP
jgi:transcriptional regulator with XRE-family HTH domain